MQTVKALSGCSVQVQKKKNTKVFLCCDFPSPTQLESPLWFWRACKAQSSDLSGQMLLDLETSYAVCTLILLLNWDHSVNASKLMTSEKLRSRSGLLQELSRQALEAVGKNTRSPSPLDPNR